MSKEDKFDELRQRALRKLESERHSIEQMSKHEIEKVVHELKVYQIELEMQNEELRLTQEDLRRSRHEYTELFDFAPVGYFVISLDKLVRKVNLTATTLLQVARSEVLNRPLNDFIKRDRLDEWFLHTRKILVHGKSESIELEMVRADQSSINVYLKSEPVLDSRGNITGSRIALVDITPLKEAEQLRQAHAELKKRAQQLTASNTDLTKKTAQLSKLTSALANAEKLERKRLAKVLHDNLQQLIVAAKLNVGSIISRTEDEDLKTSAQDAFDLLDESVRATRSLSIDLYPPVLQESGLIDSLRWLCRWVKQTHKLSVEFQAAPQEDDYSEEVKILLFESVRELLFNAVKHAGVSEASVRVDRDQESIKIVVSDKGEGFDQSDAQTNAEKLGFGLFNMRQRIAFYDGTLQIESSPGKGAVFTIALPLSERLGSEGEVAEKSVTEDQQTSEKLDGIVRVLLVDDHTVVRQGFAALLKKEPDIEIAGEASDGQQAVEMARQIHPDVVLMDYNMPNLNGVDATRIIHSELPDINIIGLSMFDETELANAMIQAGATAFLSKTGPVEDLVNKVRAGRLNPH